MKTFLIAILALLCIVTLVISCSDDPTGPGDIEIDFPNQVGCHWQYELHRVMESNYDTVDVDIICDTMTLVGKPATSWVFDYHGVLDTVYIIAGGETLHTYIGIMPPPDTCKVCVSGDSVTMYSESLFDFSRIVYKYPLEVGKQWQWADIYWTQLDHSSGVVSIEAVTVNGNTYADTYKIISTYQPLIAVQNWDYIRTTVWLDPDVGLIKAFEDKISYNSSTHIEESVGINVWELLEYNPAS